MIGGLVEVAETGRHLSVHRGFLKVSDGDGEIGRVPLDDISALILAGPQITLTKSLMVALAERQAVVVTCGRNWHPIAFTLPFATHYEAAGLLHDQIAASQPLCKRLWQTLVQAKIENQKRALLTAACDAAAITGLETLRRQVKSGDPDNREAQAARLYWPQLMGRDFRRDRDAEGANALPNYGYTVLRAATARALCGAGLHPALGLHHRSRINPFALVDDAMEPFRPLVDLEVRALSERGAELGVAEKRRLAAVLQTDMLTDQGNSPVVNCLGSLARSLASSLRDKQVKLEVALVKPGDLLI
ncbi:MAG: type II CRISPR-associated endonuclease Cas1 [Kiloniellales bacterium]